MASVVKQPPADVRVMIAVPVVMPERTPVDPPMVLTVAVDVLELVHVPLRLPVNVDVDPVHTFEAPVIVGFG